MNYLVRNVTTNLSKTNLSKTNLSKTKSSKTKLSKTKLPSVKKTVLLLSMSLFSVSATAQLSFFHTKPVGAVFSMTNAVDGNEVVVYGRNLDGNLTYQASYATDGLGGLNVEGDANDALGSQSPLVLSKNGRCLFAVNAGDNSISSFIVDKGNELKLAQNISSNGSFPVSIAINRDLLYVLNAGDQGNISGFNITRHCGLSAIDNSTRELGAEGTTPPSFIQSPAQVAFTPDGDALVVTLKGDNAIKVFSLKEDIPDNVTTTPSNGLIPFGFTFKRDYLLVAEAFGNATDIGTPETGAVSSYEILADGSLQLISASVENKQTATCWLATARYSPFVFSSNNGSSSISGYHLNRYNGKLTLLDNGGVSGSTGQAPVDFGLTKYGRYLYSVNAGDGTISMFRVNPWSGALESLGEVDGLPVNGGAVGIAIK